MARVLIVEDDVQTAAEIAAALGDSAEAEAAHLSGGGEVWADLDVPLRQTGEYAAGYSGVGCV